MSWRCCLLVLLLVAAEASCSGGNDTDCALDVFSKVLFSQGNGRQYVEYEESVPPLSAFTLHYWIRVVEPSSHAYPFSYYNERDGNTIQVVLVKTDRAASPVWRWVLQVNGMVVSIVKSPHHMQGQWHHVLHSWHGSTGTWSLYMNGKLVESGVNEHSRGMMVSGGGRAFSGQHYKVLSGLSRASCSNCTDGLNGWLTLLSLDSQGIQRADYWANLLMVSVVAAGCRPEHGGDVLSWKDTPRRGYGGAMESRAAPSCGNF